jgi:general secretion pathway protein F
VRAEVMSGHPLAVALEGHPSTFPDLYRAVVATGEQSGDLPAVLARLADYLERREAVRQRAGLALVYPAIVAGIALLIVVGLLVYVAPQVVEVFERSRQSLPLLTRVMMGLSGAIYSHAAWLVAAAVVLAMGVRALYGRRAFRYRCHAMILKAPVLGSLVRGAESARFASSLAILIGSGVPLLHALATGGKVVSNLVLRHATDHAIRQVREGASLHGALRSTGQFPAIFVHMVASGEASGRLGHMLSQAARQQEAENDARARLLTSLLEPAIIVVMGVFVLLVVLAVLLPIIEMNQLIRA